MPCYICLKIYNKYICDSVKLGEYYFSDKKVNYLLSSEKCPCRNCITTASCMFDSLLNCSIFKKIWDNIKEEEYNNV